MDLILNAFQNYDWFYDSLRFLCAAMGLFVLSRMLRDYNKLKAVWTARFKNLYFALFTSVVVLSEGPLEAFLNDRGASVTIWLTFLALSFAVTGVLSGKMMEYFHHGSGSEPDPGSK